MEFHTPYATINTMESVNLIEETSLNDPSYDLTFYNVHNFPKLLECKVFNIEEFILFYHGAIH